MSVRQGSWWLAAASGLAMAACGHSVRQAPAPVATGGDGGADGVGGSADAGAPGEGNCDPGEQTCRDGDVYVCEASGAGFGRIEICNSGFVCDPETFGCEEQVCSEPGKLICDGEVVRQCGPLGLALLEPQEDCAEQELTCWQGECRACVPGAQYCDQGDIYQCDAEGKSKARLQDCSDAYHCEQVPGGFTCLPDNCQSAICVGNVLKQCVDGGLTEGKDCGDQVCSAGACKAKVCDPAAGLLCQEGDVYECVAAGAETQLERECPYGLRCGQLVEGTDCVAVVCEAGQPACVGNQIGACAGDGDKLSVVTLDCIQNGQVCDTTPECVSNVVDVTNPTDQTHELTSEVLLGVVVDVTSDRTLDQLQVPLSLLQPVTLTWVVYERYQGQYVLMLTDVTTSIAGDGYSGSGELDFALHKGARYVLGVQLPLSDPPASYYEQALAAPVVVSFGSLVGGMTAFSSIGDIGSAQDFYPSFEIPTLGITTSLPQ